MKSIKTKKKTPQDRNAHKNYKNSRIILVKKKNRSKKQIKICKKKNRKIYRYDFYNKKINFSELLNRLYFYL